MFKDHCSEDILNAEPISGYLEHNSFALRGAGLRRCYTFEDSGVGV